jgi:hypothetical protein
MTNAAVNATSRNGSADDDPALEPALASGGV